MTGDVAGTLLVAMGFCALMFFCSWLTDKVEQIIFNRRKRRNK